MVDGLVLRENGLLVVVTMEDAWQRANHNLLVASAPGAVGPVVIEAVFEAGLGQVLRVKDSSGADALSSFPVWDRNRAAWVNPFRPDGPPLPGPGPKP